jgi:hypothetical protein
MKRLDIRDYFVMALLSGLAAAGSVYVFKWPSNAAFGIWAGVVGTLTGAFHFLSIGDDKRKDDNG